MNICINTYLLEGLSIYHNSCYRNDGMISIFLIVITSHILYRSHKIDIITIENRLYALESSQFGAVALSSHILHPKKIRTPMQFLALPERKAKISII